MTDFKNVIAKLRNNLNVLREREAKHAGNVPVDLLNQIADHEQAIMLTEQALTGEITEVEWGESLKPLLVSLDREAVDLIRPTEAFCKILDRAVPDFEKRIYKFLARATPSSAQPYKFLYPFDIEDTDIFFGRDTAINDLYRTVLRDRLTVLHAPSGAGKTSLLHAGLSPRLIQDGRLPVYARVYDVDPVMAIKQALAPASLGFSPELMSRLSLPEFLGLICTRLDRTTQELVIILDQFEEFFIFWPTEDHRQPFIDTLAECYGDKTLPIRFIIALRKDYYSDLADFQPRIPTVFYNDYRLNPMGHLEARAAITGPITRRGRAVIFEPDLLEALLADLSHGEIELPHLQIVCTRLYQALALSETTIRLGTYEKLGRAEGILSDYLNNVLAKLSASRQEIAKTVLKELVSSEATKRVLSQADLATRLETIEQNELDAVLRPLVQDRLLHRDDYAGEIVYELAHEYLIEEIKSWLNEADLTLKQAEELLRRETANRRAYGTLIPRDRLEILYAHRQQLKGLDNETWECLLQSVLQANFAVEDWSRISGQVGEKFLRVTLHNSQDELRMTAIRGLSAIWELPELSKLGDRNNNVRRTAVETIAKINDSRVAEVLNVILLGDEDNGVRRAVATVLGEIGESFSVEPLIIALGDEEDNVRQAATEALVKIGEPAVKPLIIGLEDEEDNVRQAATEALVKIGEPAVEPLTIALGDEDRRNQRKAIIKILGEMKDIRAVEPLITVLSDEDNGVRRAVAKALGEIGEPYSVEPLIIALGDEEDNVRQAATEALVKVGEPAVEPLTIALGQEDRRNQRAVIVGILGEIGDVRAVEPLITALTDEQGAVRRAAAKALDEIGEPYSVEPLIITLGDKQGAVRQAVAKALGEIGDVRAVESLITAALGDEEGAVRQAAAKALGKIGDVRAVERLITTLGTEEGTVRQAAANALGEMGDVRAVEPLITAALGDEEGAVRQAAAKAAKEIGGVRVVEPLRGRFNMETLEEINPSTVELLIKQLSYYDYEDELGSYQIQATAARELGRIGDPRAVEPLFNALMSIEKHPRYGNYEAEDSDERRDAFRREWRDFHVGNALRTALEKIRTRE